ncbi:MAG: hypothetical protein QW270_07985 [Candidatus Bathyarchaeia archaeon]
MPSLYATLTVKAFVPKLYLGEIDPDCKVYLFAFTEMNQLNPKLQKALTKWGKEAGKNLFVGFWARDDENFQKAVHAFKLKKVPAIVITAGSQLAFMNETAETVYARIDDEKILQDDNFLNLAKKTLERLYLLFLDGKVQEAIKEAEKAHDKRKLLDFLRKVKDSFGVVGKFLDEHKISVEFGNFKFETEPSK